MAKLGECKLIPMVIKVDESEGIVASRPYRYSPQKMDIIDSFGSMTPKSSNCLTWASLNRTNRHGEALW